MGKEILKAVAIAVLTTMVLAVLSRIRPTLIIGWLGGATKDEIAQINAAIDAIGASLPREGKGETGIVPVTMAVAPFVQEGIAQPSISRSETLSRRGVLIASASSSIDTNAAEGVVGVDILIDGRVCSQDSDHGRGALRASSTCLKLLDEGSREIEFKHSVGAMDVAYAVLSF